jgi:hypothetical protein
VDDSSVDPAEKRLSEERRSLVERYMIDAEEAQARAERAADEHARRAAEEEASRAAEEAKRAAEDQAMRAAAKKEARRAATEAKRAAAEEAWRTAAADATATHTPPRSIARSGRCDHPALSPGTNRPPPSATPRTPQPPAVEDEFDGLD